ncbi:MAG: hypothetical protein KAS32_16845 [Candidatus Peribacteraceae bacterium]|nr:hypothetical protein [Candidatus Peribacteraceae bacterium]
MKICKSGCAFFENINSCPEGCKNQLDTDGLRKQYQDYVNGVVELCGMDEHTEIKDYLRQEIAAGKKMIHMFDRWVKGVQS